MPRLRIFLSLFFFLAPARADDESDFTTAPAADWQRVDPLNRTTFDFASAECSIAVTAPTLPEAQILGPARAALLAPTTWSQTVVCVDLIAWNPDSDRAFTGILARVQSTAGLATTSGYSLSVLNNPPLLQLYRLDNEVPTLISESLTIPLERTRSYRLVLVCAGANLTGLIYDRADLVTPIGTVTASDATYPDGRSGLLVTTDRVVALTAVFDNFLAWDGAPPPLEIKSGDEPGSFILSWDALRGLGSLLEESDRLVHWSTAEPLSISQAGLVMEARVQPTTDRAFFRRHLLEEPGLQTPIPFPQKGAKSAKKKKGWGRNRD
ncbi:MAG: hypothetical protein ABI680_06965 [Chthoniobacteraceae bacterium]